MTPAITKQPGERRLFDMDFRRLIASSDSIAGVSSATAETVGNVTGSDDITLGSTAYSGTIAQVWVESGGTDLEDYKITIKCTTTIGEIVEGEGLLRMREL